MKRLWMTMIGLFILAGAVPANAVCVRAPKANIRTGPGKNYEIVWEVYRYMPFQRVGTSLSGNWYAVKDVDGDVSWIHRNLVTRKYRCAVVKAEEANIRSGPGTRYARSPMGPARQYYSFRVVKKNGDWIKVKDEWGSAGWIHRDLVWIR